MKVIINKRGEIVALPISDGDLNDFTNSIVTSKVDHDFFSLLANNSALVAQGMLISERLQNRISSVFKDIHDYEYAIDVVVAKSMNDNNEQVEAYCPEMTLSYYSNIARGKRFMDMISTDYDQFLNAIHPLNLSNDDLSVFNAIIYGIQHDLKMNGLIEKLCSIGVERQDLISIYKNVCAAIDNSEVLSNQAHYERLRSLLESIMFLLDPRIQISQLTIKINDLISFFIASLDETLDYWSLLYTRVNDSNLLHGIRHMFDGYILAQYDGSTFNFMMYSKGERSSSFVMTKILTRFIKGKSKYNSDVPLMFKSGAVVISGIAGNGKNLFLSHLMNSFIGKKFRLDQFNSQLSILEDTDISILSMKERAEFIFDSLPGNFDSSIKVNVNDNIINFEDLITNITCSKQKVIIINSILPFVREVESKHKGGTQKNGIKSGPIDDVLSTLNSLGQMLGKLIICTYRPLDASQQDDLIQNISAQVWLAISLHDNETTIVDRTGTSDQMIYKNDSIKSIIDDDESIDKYLGKFKIIKVSEDTTDEFTSNYDDHLNIKPLSYAIEL